VSFFQTKQTPTVSDETDSVRRSLKTTPSFGSRTSLQFSALTGSCESLKNTNTGSKNIKNRITMLENSANRSKSSYIKTTSVTSLKVPTQKSINKAKSDSDIPGIVCASSGSQSVQKQVTSNSVQYSHTESETDIKSHLTGNDNIYDEVGAAPYLVQCMATSHAQSTPQKSGAGSPRSDFRSGLENSPIEHADSSPELLKPPVLQFSASKYSTKKLTSKSSFQQHLHNEQQIRTPRMNLKKQIDSAHKEVLVVESCQPKHSVGSSYQSLTGRTTTGITKSASMSGAKPTTGVQVHDKTKSDTDLWNQVPTSKPPVASTRRKLMFKQDLPDVGMRQATLMSSGSSEHIYEEIREIQASLQTSHNSLLPNGHESVQKTPRVSQRLNDSDTASIMSSGSHIRHLHNSPDFLRRSGRNLTHGNTPRHSVKPPSYTPTALGYWKQREQGLGSQEPPRTLPQPSAITTTSDSHIALIKRQEEDLENLHNFKPLPRVKSAAGSTPKKFIGSLISRMKRTPKKSKLTLIEQPEEDKF